MHTGTVHSNIHTPFSNWGPARLSTPVYPCTKVRRYEGTKVLHSYIHNIHTCMYEGTKVRMHMKEHVRMVQFKKNEEHET